MNDPKVVEIVEEACFYTTPVPGSKTEGDRYAHAVLDALWNEGYEIVKRDA